MNIEVEIRELTGLDEFQACVDIQKEVWGFDDPFDVAPLPLLIVSQKIGGVVVGAFSGEKMIGFVYSLPGVHHGRRIQWSHMLAVIPEHQNSDIGFQLKLAQYGMSQQKGYEMLEWTYDPLESRNAYFNLKKLGCTAQEYVVNIYGETSSILHRGMPTDRLVVQWQIPPFTKRPLEWTHVPEHSALITSTRRWKEDLLLIDEINLDCQEEYLFVEIPQDIQKLKTESPKEALKWRLNTRRIFLHYLAKDYIAYSFLYWQKARSFYVLKKV